MAMNIVDVRANKGDSSFIVDDGKTAILYDSGFGFTADIVAKNIKNYLGERNLDYIFLTHSHYDHALGSARLAQLFPNAKVVAGEYAKKIFAKDSARSLMRELDSKFAKKCGVCDYKDYTPFLRADICVSDGDAVKTPTMDFEVIALPGHTKCSIAFYNKKEKLLLACETLGVFNGKDDVVPSYLVGYQMTLDSIEKAQKLEIEKVLVPHYGLLTGDMAKFYLKRAKQSAVETAEEVVGLLKNNTPKEEILEMFKKKFYHGYVKEIYPVDAMELNTSITINLLEKELIK